MSPAQRKLEAPELCLCWLETFSEFYLTKEKCNHEKSGFEADKMPGPVGVIWLVAHGLLSSDAGSCLHSLVGYWDWQPKA